MKKDICAHCGDEIWKARPSEMPTFPPDLEALLTASNKLDPQWRHLADGLRRCQVRHTLATPSDETVV
jgi:hypothetical protein